MLTWLPELIVSGAFHYRICPALDHELREAVDQALALPDDADAALQQQLFDKEREMRDLVGLQRSVQQALGGVGDGAVMASRICAALCHFTGVRHTALLRMHERGDLQLAAQESRNRLDLVQLMRRRDRVAYQRADAGDAVGL